MLGEKVISIVTVSKRTGWERRAREQIFKQTAFIDNPHGFEWVVAQELDPKADPQYSGKLDIKWIEPPEKVRRSNLNASLNAALRDCADASEYVLFYQDFIDLPDDCFEKLIDLADERTLVTTVTRNLPDEPDDPRYLGVDLPRPCRPEEWEANVAIAPMAVIRELGGFDEDYDSGWAWDNVNLAERAAMLGCQFVLDETNRPQLLYHPKVTDMPLNGERHVRTMWEIRTGRKPLRLSYLNAKVEP